jgi:hypothetical protein
MYLPTADLFARMRTAQAAQPFQKEFMAGSTDDNGLERFITATRRQNFLVPPRRHRAFPLLELADGRPSQSRQSRRQASQSRPAGTSGGPVSGGSNGSSGAGSGGSNGSGSTGSGGSGNGHGSSGSGGHGGSGGGHGHQHG